MNAVVPWNMRIIIGQALLSYSLFFDGCKAFDVNICISAKTLDQTTQYRKTNHWPILLKL